MILKILIFITVFLYLSSSSNEVLGKSKEEELKRFRNRIREEKTRIKKVEKKERSVLSELELIEKAIKEKEREFKDYDHKLKETEKKIKEVESGLVLLNKRIIVKRDHLRERLRAVYKQGRRGYYYGVLIGAKDSEDLFKRYKYLRVTADQDYRFIESYKKDMAHLKKNLVSLEKLKEEFSSYRDKVKEKEKEMKDEKNKKLTLLTSLKTEKNTRERLIKELEEAAKNLETLIKESDRKIEVPPVSGTGFAGQKGRLPWPSEGRLMTLFGKQIDAEFNTPIFKRGIEIRTQSGDDIKAIHKGSVVYADWFKGYGKMLIINHGERYYSVYAHASDIFPKVGETVSDSQVIGKIGDTGSIKGPILYFEIRYKGEPQDPLVWLRKK